MNRERSAEVTHPSIEAQVDAWLDGELAGPDAQALEAHLAGCPECARFRDGRLALRAAIGGPAPPYPPPEPPPRRGPPAPPPPAGPGAAPPRRGRPRSRRADP